MIALKIDVNKIDPKHLYPGKTTRYLDVVLKDNKDGTDQYGNDGMVVQSVGKEAREAGERGPILGNWKHIGKRPAAAPTAKPSAPPTAGNDLAAEALPF